VKPISCAPYTLVGFSFLNDISNHHEESEAMTRVLPGGRGPMAGLCSVAFLIVGCAHLEGKPKVEFMDFTTETFTRVFDLPSESVPLTLDESREIVSSFLKEKHIDLSPYYLASITLRLDREGRPLWEHTYHLKKLAFHNHVWVLVYDTDDVRIINEQ
jgi:hypothetical protein